MNQADFSTHQELNFLSSFSTIQKDNFCCSPETANSLRKNGILILDILCRDKNLSKTRKCFIFFQGPLLSTRKKIVKSLKWQNKSIFRVKTTCY